jgi:cytoskeletal protein CcmA (bactofilin family)
MSNWLDLSNVSNILRQTYVNGFLDASGPMIGRADVSFNQKLFVIGDVSFNSRLFVGSDASLNSSLYVHGDTLLNKRIIVGSDASINGNISTNNISVKGIVFQF